ncbi:MAG: class I SAM-dependent methyltransferase [Candidatus Latescibacteria bacterium]|nr:class I SAM-dependent methyltransferase [Candidatus Latescibacterota bacterium]MDP7633394.1 class I SAM-dependent methyltransferase [Candidatus Latescibacterota bacterium]
MASGDNYVAFALVGLGAKVTSIDISEQQLDVARERAAELRLEMNSHRADAADLAGVADASSDLVVSSNGFFVWISEPRAVFDAVFRILRLGGHYEFYHVHPFTRPWEGPVHRCR